MYLTIWQCLGISPTKDEQAIQSAYAGAVKRCHPEDDPEGWSRLHDAYLQALRYARGESGTIVSASKSPDRSRREEGPASAFAAEFEAALACTDADDAAQRVKDIVGALRKQKRFIRSSQLGELPGLLFELHAGTAAGDGAIRTALLLFSEGRFTAEADEAILYFLEEYVDRLSGIEAGTGRMALRKVASRCEKAREQKGLGWRDGLFAVSLALVSGLALVGVWSDEMFAALSLLGACAFMAYRLKVRGRNIPRERRSGRALLAVVLLIVYMGSFAASRYYAAMGYEMTYTLEEACPAYAPTLPAGTEACFTVTEEPAFLCLSLTDLGSVSSVTGYVHRKCCYECFGADGARVLVFLDEDDEEAFLALPLPAVIYGTVSDISGGLFIARSDGNVPAVFLAQESMALFETMSSLKKEIGPYPALRYAGSEPKTVEVPAGYEPGHFPFILFWTLRRACFVRLALLLTRLRRAK